MGTDAQQEVGELEAQQEDGERDVRWKTRGTEDVLVLHRTWTICSHHFERLRIYTNLNASGGR